MSATGESPGIQLFASGFSKRLLGTTGYHFIERYPLIDAFSMTVITIASSGFGERYRRPKMDDYSPVD